MSHLVSLVNLVDIVEIVDLAYLVYLPVRTLIALPSQLLIDLVGRVGSTDLVDLGHFFCRPRSLTSTTSTNTVISIN